MKEFTSSNKKSQTLMLNLSTWRMSTKSDYLFKIITALLILREAQSLISEEAKSAEASSRIITWPVLFKSTILIVELEALRMKDLESRWSILRSNLQALLLKLLLMDLLTLNTLQAQPPKNKLQLTASTLVKLLLLIKHQQAQSQEDRVWSEAANL